MRKMVVMHNTTCFRARKKDITFKYFKHLKKHTVVFFIFSIGQKKWAKKFVAVSKKQ